MVFLKEDVEVSIRCGPFVGSSDGYTAYTTASPTVYLSKNHGTFAARNGTTWTHDRDGWYTCQLTTTDTSTPGPLVLSVAGSSSYLPVFMEFQVCHANVFDSLFGAAAADLLDVNASQAGGSTVASGAIPNAVAGAAGGLFIAGTNAATTITTSGGSALTLSSTGANGSGLAVSGNGTGSGILATGGSTSGHGIASTGGGTGNGMKLLGGGTSGAGLDVRSQGGTGGANYAIYAAGNSSGVDTGGMYLVGGTTGGEGLECVGGGNGHGIYVVGAGTGEGFHAVGGATGDGITGVGGGASNSGMTLTRGGVGGDDLKFTNNDCTIPTVTALANGSITAAVIATGAIDADAIAANAITASAFATDAIDNRVLAADAIGSSELAATAAAEIADAVWDELATGHTDAGKAGQQLWTDVDAILDDTGTAGVVVGSIANNAITASAIATGAIDADALAADAVDEILDEQIGDSTITMRQALKLLVATLGGKLSGAATTTITIRNYADSTDVVSATVDANGNRTATTLTL